MTGTNKIRSVVRPAFQSVEVRSETGELKDAHGSGALSRRLHLHARMHVKTDACGPFSSHIPGHKLAICAPTYASHWTRLYLASLATGPVAIGILAASHSALASMQTSPLLSPAATYR